MEEEVAMRRTSLYFVLLVALVLLSPQVSHQNPIVRPFCSEFMLTDSGWVIEMHLQMGMPPNFDGWSLGGNSDTIPFKMGIQAADYMLITTRELAGNLDYDRNSDRVLLFAPSQTHPDGILIYGDLPGSMIAAPRPGQSLCYQNQENFFYLDNTPTLGAPNDEHNAMGIVHGTVTDSSGKPIEGAQVMYHDWMGRFVYTDSAGRYEFNDYAKLQDIYFSHPKYVSTWRSLQMWPESTIVLPVVMGPLVSVKDGGPTSPRLLQLSVNYPNPFNPSTSFTLTIHKPGFVSCCIYTVHGDEVARPLEGRMNPGTYQITWSAEGLASGIYLCRVSLGEQMVTQKVVLLR